MAAPRPQGQVLVEVCVESVAGALAAREGGADRVELCAALAEGGVTPSAAAVELAVERCGLPVHVLVRPRGGDFCYSPLELETMLRDVERAKRLGARGIVTGVLREDGSVDVERTRALVEAARPLSVTFHRAFDQVRDPFEALEALIELGIDRILTSGQERTALEGAELIAELVRRAAGRIGVLPGGGITGENVREVVTRTGAREVHLSARSRLESPMRHRNLRCVLGGEARPGELVRSVTDPAKVRAVVESLREEGRR
ncbi:MAG: copper homeostasis protein CutC [Planctomycetes bacterium]|nr:copper homeostasis protein CutC [Planctomycetota bacterium]